ncbi:hypothetical protein P153DRAFT_299858 [Dothidotthia symphoricarpi CBS 119687]|uniref:Small nuclear ribonucleoprotein Prp3 C-terminal domain-containing protein n=1 Tax=Dothidotthia symphoricarpi CBS 119687 TaxID=1392245 RepID=A0A6A6A2L6_9PLEO|nr:uncharacterized protein P153DRAFT_299858 [Dothidotthia symphoricarpi CBS 119687]KAF2125414.1 hypothetical protein P153DRAFT_299858 [Dothidotthia symphoricarpi CBS 119687]
MSNSRSWQLLPPDLVELQIGQVDLLMAMYPDEVKLDESSEALLDTLREGSNDDPSATFSAPPTISIPLRLPIPTSESDNATQESLLLNLTVPFMYEGSSQPEEPPQIKVRIQQASWMSRATTSKLMDEVSETEDLLGTLEFIKEATALHLKRFADLAADKLSPDSVVDETYSLVRVWFYFPSISTRSKRDDFVQLAPQYNLTGFLYAGKPGLLCVEGSSTSIDLYMRYIKTESWGDIPAHHKKVSERYREESATRAFSDMTEITDSVGERRGHRMNRSDMKAIEDWLVERGLGDAFTKVLM